jgi:hypothetical protein
MGAVLTPEVESEMISLREQLLAEGVQVRGLGYGSSENTIDFMVSTPVDQERALALLPAKIGQHSVTVEVHDWR